MADNYVPKFQYNRDWRDNVDLVAAEGDDGFNRRFQDLREEFKEIARIMNAINGSVDELRRQVAILSPRNITLTFAPAFCPSGESREGGSWFLRPPDLLAISNTFSEYTIGWCPLQLPNGFRVTQVRIQYSMEKDKNFRIRLLAKPASYRDDGHVFVDTALPWPDSPLDVQTEEISVSSSKIIDNSSNAYLLQASVQGKGGVAVVIHNFQIVLGSEPNFLEVDLVRRGVLEEIGRGLIGNASRDSRLDLSGIIRR